MAMAALPFLFGTLLLSLVLPSLGVDPTTCGTTAEAGYCSISRFIANSNKATANSLVECWTHCRTIPGAVFFSYAPTFSLTGFRCTCFEGCSTRTDSVESFNGLISACPISTKEQEPQAVDETQDTSPSDSDSRLGRSYCLFSDASLHINALFGGHHHDVSSKIQGRMREIGLLWMDSRRKKHTAVLTSRRGMDPASGSTGFVSNITLDGVSQTAPLQAGESITGSGGFRLTLVSNKSTLSGAQSDRYELELVGLLKAQINLNAEEEKMRSADDAEVHFDLKINSIQVSPTIHGILGQAFRPGMIGARAAQYKILSKLMGTPEVEDRESGAGFLDGSTSDYEASALMRTDCTFAQGPWVELR